jgi:hypothetical protein
MAPKKGSTRPSGTVAQAPKSTKAPTKSPIGPGSGYLGYKPPTKTNTKTDTKTKTNVPTTTVTPPVAKSVVSVDRYTDANGNIIERFTFSDGSQTTNNLGVDPGVLAQRTNWIEELKAQYDAAGLGALGNRVVEFVQQGFDPETIDFKIRETPEFKLRFPGNEARKKAGLPVLSLDEYVALENAYQSVFRESGFAKGFYDSKDDFTRFIEQDISPQELKQRVDIASMSIDNADPYFVDSLQRLYGIPKADMVAYALDPERALPFITRQVQAAQFGGEAARQGLQIDRNLAETYTGLGVSQAQARQGFEQVAGVLPVAERLSQITAGAQPVGVAELTSVAFGGAGSAEYKQRLQSLAEQEQSRFAGQSGVGRSSLTQQTQGQF